MHERRALLAVYLASGAAGLVYEVVWSRLLGLAVGVEATAVTAVLAAFMGGLTLGSWLGGKLASRPGARPLRDYALLELAVGLACLATPEVIRGLVPLLRIAYADLGPGAAFDAVRAIACTLVLAVPATLLGATLPVLSPALVRPGEDPGESLGGLYAANTFGAVVGALLAGFALIPRLGVARANEVAVGTSVLAGGLAWWLERRRASRESVSPEPDATASALPVGVGLTGPPLGRAALAIVLVGFALSGAAGMAFQLAWTRALAVVLGPTTYTFSLIVAATILGHALGSARFASRARTFPRPLATLALAEVGAATIALASLPFFERAPEGLLPLVNGAAPGSLAHAAAEFFVAFPLVAGPAFLLGAAFPLVARATVRDLAKVGRTVGTAYAWNSIGAVAGTIAGGALFLPRCGIQGTVGAAAVLAALAGSAFLVAEPQLAPALRWLALVLPFAVFGVNRYAIPSWDPLRINSGAYLYAEGSTAQVKARRGGGLHDERLFYREGFLGTVLVARGQRGGLYLKLDGKVDAGTSTEDMRTQLLLGHVPCLVAPEEPAGQAPVRRALLVGLGSGVTLRALRAAGVPEIDLVELDPNVVDAVKDTALEVVSRRALDDPGAPRILVEDARAVLGFEPRAYDVIVSEPSNPWIAGVGNLFTRESFTLARERLSERGVFCQWVHAGYASRETFRLVARTFQSVFPDATLWEVFPNTDYLLLGARAPLLLDAGKLAKRFGPPVQRDLSVLELRAPLDILWTYCMGPAELRAFAGDGPLNTDDDALLEHQAPGAMDGSYDALHDPSFLAGRRPPPGAPEPFEQARRTALLALRAARVPERALEALRAVEATERLDPGRGAARASLSMRAARCGSSRGVTDAPTTPSRPRSPSRPCPGRPAATWAR